MTERFNRTLMGMLGTLETEQKQDWKRYVAPLVHAYNCTRHESTGFSPYELMYGRAPRIPVDLIFGTHTDVSGTTQVEYVAELKDRIQKSYEIVHKTAEASRGETENTV